MYEGFKTRYFNQISYDLARSEITKISTNTSKLQSEYLFLDNIPYSLKGYFVDAYDYESDNNSARYRMSYIDAADVAKQFVENSISKSEYEDLLVSISEYLNRCPAIVLDRDQGYKEAYDLVVEKSKYRIKLLENDSRWVESKYRILLENAGLTLNNLLAILEERFIHFSKNRESWIKRFSHGDLCFSNILWSPNRNIFKLIDPKGIESSYLDEYYDIAKICHSVVGNYDDIIYGNYIANYDSLSIEITRFEDSFFKEKFKDWVVSRGLDYDLQLLYQTSMFISMLPNHLEDDARVGAFILNAYKHLSILGGRF